MRIIENVRTVGYQKLLAYAYASQSIPSPEVSWSNTSGESSMDCVGTSASTWLPSNPVSSELWR